MSYKKAANALNKYIGDYDTLRPFLRYISYGCHHKQYFQKHYARPEGMGKAFGKYADRRSCLMVTAYTAAVLALIGWQALLAAAAAAVFSFWCGRYVTNLLGGMTGDVYGTLCTVSELIVLLVYLFSYSVFY